MSAGGAFSLHSAQEGAFSAEERETRGPEAAPSPEPRAGSVTFPFLSFQRRAAPAPAPASPPRAAASTRPSVPCSFPCGSMGSPSNLKGQEWGVKQFPAKLMAKL